MISQSNINYEWKERSVYTIIFVSGGFADVSEGGYFNDISNDEFLYGLIFGTASATVGATDEPHVSAPLLISSVVASFERLQLIII